MGKIVILPKEFAHFLLTHTASGKEFIDNKDHYLLDQPGGFSSYLLKTGAKLGKNDDGEYYISGYSQDGSDVNSILESMAIFYSVTRNICTSESVAN
jgi:hypothetical protein